MGCGGSQLHSRREFQERSESVSGIFPEFQEGANREKLTVKKLIDSEMFFCSPFMSLTNREKSA